MASYGIIIVGNGKSIFNHKHLFHAGKSPVDTKKEKKTCIGHISTTY